MIYLTTGGNGSCKTLFTLQDVRKLQLETNRPVFYNGRTRIYPHIVEEFGWKLMDFKDWQSAPDGAIFFIDEAQNDLPLRSNSAPAPEPIMKLAEHRVRGFDFFFITPHPMLIDAFVRKLVQAPGWHRHLKRRFGASDTTTVIQWEAVRVDCEKDGVGKTAQVEGRKQPKHVYEWYESAFIHTGKVRIPKQVWTLLACLVGFLLLVAFAVYRFNNLHAASEKPVDAKTTSQAPTLQAVPQQSAHAPEKAVLTAVEYAQSYEPRITGLPQTAPRYDNLTQPTTAPYPAACVHMGSRCGCYSQQGTRLDVPAGVCEQIVKTGFFMDWQQGPTSANAAQPVSQSVTSKQEGQT